MDHNKESNGVTQESFSSSSKRQKTKSKTWEGYEKLPRDSYYRLRGKCTTYGDVFLSDSTLGTTNLNLDRARHLKQAASQVMPIKHQDYRDKVAKAIVRHNYSFCFVEHEGIRELHAFLNPTIKTLSRNTVGDDISKLYQKQKEIVKNELAVIQSRICLTFD